MLFQREGNTLKRRIYLGGKRRKLQQIDQCSCQPLKVILKVRNRRTKPRYKQCNHGNTCYCACAIRCVWFSWGEHLYSEQAAVRRSLIILLFGCGDYFGARHTYRYFVHWYYYDSHILTVAEWDYGSGENQYRATRFSNIAKWECISRRTVEKTPWNPHGSPWTICKRGNIS